MTDAFSGTLHLKRFASNTPRVLLGSLYGIAFAVLAVLSVDRPSLAFVLPLVAACAWQADRHARLLGDSAIKRLRWAEDGRWSWQTTIGSWHDAELRTAVTFGTTLVVLGLSDPKRSRRLRYCVCFRDGLDADTHRRLRARLTVRPAYFSAADD